MSSTDASKQGGVCAWMASVRASMDNDSSRKIFEEQVHSHAFVFLDNYLEHILAGPKRGPIIELVKTPARRKNLPRRTRAATAATSASASVKSTTFFSLDDDGSVKDDIPVNSFHKALLRAKETSVQDVSDPRKFTANALPKSNSLAVDTHGRSMSVQVVDIPKISVSLEPEAGPVSLQRHPGAGESSLPLLTSEHGTELSVIAEGDESPERSHANPFPTVAHNHNVSRQTQEHPVAEENLKAMQTTKFSEDHAQGTGHSIPSPVDAHYSLPPAEMQRSEASQLNHTESLPSRTVTDSPRNRERNAFTAPLPAVPVSNPIPIPHTTSVPLNDMSSKTLGHKNSTAGFPMLPAPSPLRKSLRVIQDVPGASQLPIVTPAPKPLGKRTSWLMKAREAKAMEVTGSLPETAVAAVSGALPRVSTAVKRKSGEMLGDLPPGDLDKNQRKPKVAKSNEVSTIPLNSQETEKTILHDISSAQGEPATMCSIAAAMALDQLEPRAMDVDKQVSCPDSVEEGFIDLFKRTVEGLGARAGKSMGKSLGGAAAAALAEARAAAEAKVAERNKVSSESGESQDHEPLETHVRPHDEIIPVSRVNGTERRLSLSDLVPAAAPPNPAGISTEVTQVIGEDNRINDVNEFVSTSPPDSPPSKSSSSGFVKPSGPVFNKPPPPKVFMPPVAKQFSTFSEYTKESSSNPSSGRSTVSDAMSFDIPRLAAPSDAISPFVQTSNTTARSSRSNIVYTTDLQPSDPSPATAVAVNDDGDDDDDDSWPLEEKLAAAEPGWRPFDFSNVDKEDTWSSLPTESQGTTRNLTTEMRLDPVPLSNDTDTEAGVNDEVIECERETDVVLDVEHSIMNTGTFEVAATGTNAGNIDSEPIARATSQTSLASSSSSQSQAGFFSQATKLVNSVLGGGKRAKPELKSLQLAAMAAKKQQEEADKKMQRMKDMEARRQIAIAKKVEEERTRLLEDEKRSKEEFEKRKREREENTDRRPLKPSFSTKKVEDDTSKKRKLGPESEKKPEGKKLPSKDKDPVPQAKMAVTPVAKVATLKSTKVTAPALISSAAYNATQNPLPAKLCVPEAKPFKVVASSKGKGKAKPQEDDMGDKLPTTVVQSQMAARAKAQMQAAKVPEVPSESIELPDINSEYSDSGDEDRVRTFDPPNWAQSPELRQALQMQSTVNPDDIFGAIRPLRMEEVFRTRQSRFRARTSSANWSGSDMLTLEEIREYERRMGFQRTETS